MQLSNVLLHSFGFSKEPVARVSSTGSLLCGAISKPLCPPFPGARHPLILSLDIRCSNLKSKTKISNPKSKFCLLSKISNLETTLSPFPGSQTRLFSTDIRRSDASSDPDSRARVVFCNTDESGGNVTSRAPRSIVFLSITCPPGSAPCIMDWGVKPRAEGISTVYSHARLLFKAFLNQEPKACGRGLTSPLVLHDLKWAPLHSTTGPGRPQ